MTILIAHRGNIKGPNPKVENNPSYIETALSAGFEAEIDVWLTTAGFMLGHDEPMHLIGREWIEERKDKLWCHAKNVEALIPLLERGIHCFWHQEDDVTLTNRGWLWTYPGKFLTPKSIAVMPEMLNCDVNPKAGADWLFGQVCAGICTDFVDRLK